MFLTQNLEHNSFTICSLLNSTNRGRQLKTYELRREQLLKTGIDNAWHFFSNPQNLDEITPPSMKFKITSNIDDEMYEGQIITYKIRLLPGVKKNWVTEIKTVKKNRFFIDEQRFGPYKFWHHKHIFNETPEGVLVTDIVNYALPFNFIGELAHRLFVKNKLNEIFNYRYDLLEKKFNKSKVA